MHKPHDIENIIHIWKGDTKSNFAKWQKFFQKELKNFGSGVFSRFLL